MESHDLQPGASETKGVGFSDPSWTEADIRLRTRVIEHYQWVAEWDREYAIWGYRRSRELLPWLKL